MDHLTQTPDRDALSTPPLQWYKSRAVIGAIVAIIASLMRSRDWDIGPVEPELTEAILTIASVIGGLVAAEGRISATRKIGKSGERKPETGKEASRFAGPLVVLVACLLLGGCSHYRFVGSLSAGFEGQTITVGSDGQTITTDLRLSGARGYAK